MSFLPSRVKRLLPARYVGGWWRTFLSEVALRHGNIVQARGVAGLQHRG
jgi:hypothetical protein